MDVTAEDIDRIETFVAKTLNKSFSVTISKLFVL